MTEREAGPYIGKPARTLSQWRYLGKGPPYHRIGGSIRYLQADLDAFLAEHRVDPNAAACGGSDAA